MNDDSNAFSDAEARDRRRQLAREKFERQTGRRREEKRRSRNQAAAIMGLLSGIVVGGVLVDPGDPRSIHVDPLMLWILSSCLIVPLSAFVALWFHERRKYMKNQNDTFDQRIAAEREYHAEALEQLRQAGELTTLMQLNQDQIKTYHDIVTEQADKSFKSSRIAMGIGMLLLVCAAIGGAWVPLEQVRWFIGALAAFSTLLSGYLSRTYLTLYKEAIGQLNRYFDQPVLNSYYLAAERLVGDLSEEHQDEVRKQIITEILANGARRVVGAEKSIDAKSNPRPKKRVPKQQGSSVNGASQA
ncbi:hypothetical protein [Streptomyces sp. NPDC001507]|uniref:TRADD-N-associated membrane domain-containing protein n=1 Tax=Streptomyces sp. NPDC001507 TaxID=3364579 RepID=UPI0036BAF77A